jgi:hypothetical protein
MFIKRFLEIGLTSLKYPELRKDLDNLTEVTKLRLTFPENLSEEKKEQLSRTVLHNLEPWQQHSNEDLAYQILDLKPFSSTENIKRYNFLQYVVTNRQEVDSKPAAQK